MESRKSFTSATTLDKLKAPHVPDCYVLPASKRPNPCLDFTTGLPVVDLADLFHPSRRCLVLDHIWRSCKELGFFQVVNHGIPSRVMSDALDAATEFFNLPIEEKMALLSDNVHDPVRYGTSINHANDEVHFWRDFIKQYSHPISKWLHLWPSNPPSYRDKMGRYAVMVEALQKILMEAILESLGLKAGYLEKEIEEGSQVLAVNCYPACPEPELALGIPPHSDYGTITILLQSCAGLQVMDHNNKWLSVPVIEGALVIQLGDQIEVMSNGECKSIVHQVTLSSEKRRFSIASIHSLALKKKIKPAPELVDAENPATYEGFSFGEFLDFISSNNITNERFIDTLKKNH